MNEGLIPRRYAKALLLVAQERGLATKVYDVMKRLDASFVELPQLSETLNNPYISLADKKNLILTAAGESGNKTGLLADFVKLIAENRRIGFIRLMALAYVDLYRQENHIYDVKVTSAAKLSDADQKRLMQLVEKHLNGGTMEYSMQIDPSLIGGFTVSVGNEKVDASVSNELKQLRLNLLNQNQ
ncbi:MAG: F0F1 ATP synthase subunit delta [Firmicutes bacterium]|nr:F0F1 ATP synthase subunit delta [Bacillota bacterium]MCM1400641.1 F0F1 ATP synthase subunit delta [Bacteroides sp.]MCM1476332.1 F0F1 ATP synthase subunit delta [Bacteroides sp.]